MQVKLRKYYLTFLVLNLIALILLGANRLGSIPLLGIPPKTVLSKAWVFIWSLMPSQDIEWWNISLIVLVILIILGFVAGCKLIAYFVSGEGLAEEASEVVVGLKESGLPFYKRIQLRIWGRVYLEDRWHEEWKVNVPYYLVNCPEHGLFEDYPHGRWLKCPKCGRKFYSSECWVGTGVHYPWPNREVTPWPKGAR